MTTIDVGWFVTLAMGFLIGNVYARREAIADRLGAWRWLCGADERPVVYPQSHPAVRLLQRRPYDYERDE